MHGVDMKTYYIISILSLFSLAACGGSGDSDNTTPIEPTAQITDSQQSATAVSAPASERMASGLLGGSASGNTAPVPFQIASGVARGLFKPDDATSRMQLIQANFCTTGSVTLPPADATSGTITFSDCELSGSGLYFNGSINYNAAQSSSGANITISYSNFSISDSTQMLASMSGTMNMTLSYNGNVWSTEISTTGFTVTADGETIQMGNYSNSSVIDFDASENSVSFHYAVTSNLIGGTLIVTTDPSEGGSPLVQNFGDVFPYTGTIIIIGADNDRARITINGGLATDSIVIEYALDGDGVYDDGMETLSWSEFEAQSQYAIDSIFN